MKAIGLASIICLVCLVPCKAQWDKLDIGFVSSLNLCPYTSNEEGFVFHPRLGFSVGSFLRTNLSDKISLDLGLSYLVKSYRLDLDYSDFPQNPDDPILVEDGKVIIQYTFLDIPVEINCKMNQNENFDFYLSAGLVNSIGLFSKAKFTADYPDDQRSLDGAYQLRAKGGLGFLFRTTNVSFGTEPQLGYTFLQGEKWSDDSKPLYFGLEFFILMN